MKKLFIIMCMTLMSVGAFAGKGDVYFGPQFRYHYSDYETNNFGVGGLVQWEFLKNVRLEGGASYFFKQDNYEVFMGELNLQYLFRFNKFAIYPVAGGNFFRDYGPHSFHIDTDGEGSITDYDYQWDTDIEFNVGGGVEYNITNKMKLSADCKMVFPIGQPVVSLGFMFKL